MGAETNPESSDGILAPIFLYSSYVALMGQSNIRVIKISIEANNLDIARLYQARLLFCIAILRIVEDHTNTQKIRSFTMLKMKQS